jgi:hypothetical protein
VRNNQTLARDNESHQQSETRFIVSNVAASIWFLQDFEQRTNGVRVSGEVDLPT